MINSMYEPAPTLVPCVLHFYFLFFSLTLGYCCNAHTPLHQLYYSRIISLLQPLHVARSLAAVCSKEHPDLLLLGKQGVDMDYN